MEHIGEHQPIEPAQDIGGVGLREFIGVRNGALQNESTGRGGNDNQNQQDYAGSQVGQHFMNPFWDR